MTDSAELLAKWRTDLGKVLGDELVIELRRRGAGELLTLIDTLEQANTPAPCVMTYTPPMDFAQCETHDETFPLGSKCRFDGRDMVEVLFEAVDEQRGRAVRAEMKLEHSTPNVYVTTADELDALPLDSVVVDRHGIPRTKRAGNSDMGAGWTNAGNSPLTSRELADGYLMRVAHNPKDAQ